MDLPATIPALLEAGFTRHSYSRCETCQVPIEWWWKPNKTMLIPLEFMNTEQAPVISHWRNCTMNPHRKEDDGTTEDQVS